MSRPPERPTWYLDELSTIGRENLDADHVAHYDDKEDADARGEVALLRARGLAPGAVVVDLGAGTGQFALRAAELGAQVVAVDPSPVMRDRLADNAAERSIELRIEAAGFLTYDHAGRHADVVYSRYALHHLPDYWKVIALRRIHAMLRPGGLFRLWDVVYCFSSEESDERIEGWCSSLPEEGDGWTRTDIEDHVRDEHSTYNWLLEPMIRESGFEIEDAAYSDDRFFAKYLLVRR